MLQKVVIINGQKTLVPLSGSTPTDEVAVDNMHSVTSNAVAEALSKQHYYHTSFNGSNINGWHTIDIQFDKTFKYPPIVSVCVSDLGYIAPSTETYWRESLTPFYTVTTTTLRIAYYVRDSHSTPYTVNVIGEID